MLHVDEGQLHAYLDGELATLDPAVAAEVERHLAGCPACQGRLEEERQLRERARTLLHEADPAPVAEPSFAVLAARASARAPEVRAGTRRPLATLAWAASLLLALGLGWYGRELLRSDPGPQLASAPAASTERTAEAESPAAPPPVTHSEPAMLADVAAAPVDSPAAPAASRVEPSAEVTPRVAARTAPAHAEREETRAAPPAPDPAAPAAAAPSVAQVTGAVDTAAAREGAIAHGRVTTAAGAGIPNAQVYIPALNAGTLTRADGSYALAVPANRLPHSGELTITATVIGMQSDARQVVLRPGEEVAQNFELQPANVALEELVVTGTPSRAERRRAAAVRAEAADAVAPATEIAWHPVSAADAERHLGGAVRFVPGLPLIGIAAAVLEEVPVIRVLQQLEGGAWLELLQRRATPGRTFAAEPAARAQGEAVARRPAPAAAAPPSPPPVTGEELATVDVTQEGVRITARAPLAADSLRALTTRLAPLAGRR